MEKNNANSAWRWAKRYAKVGACITYLNSPPWEDSSVNKTDEPQATATGVVAVHSIRAPSPRNKVASTAESEKNRSALLALARSYEVVAKIRCGVMLFASTLLMPLHMMHNPVSNADDKVVMLFFWYPVEGEPVERTAVPVARFNVLCLITYPLIYWQCYFSVEC